MSAAISSSITKPVMNGAVPTREEDGTDYIYKHFEQLSRPVCLPLSQNSYQKKYGMGPIRPPVREIPPYLFYYAHAVDSLENPPFRSASTSEAIEVSFYNSNTAWVRGLNYVESSLLETPLESLTPEELYQLVTELHRKITDNSELTLRKVNSAVLNNYGVDETEKGVVRKIYFAAAQSCLERGRGDLVLRIKRIWDLTVEKKGPFAAARSFEEADWEAFEQIYYFAPVHEKVEELLRLFCGVFAKHLNNSHLHSYQVAAFIHFGITKIHPFIDGNGRLARLLMNIFLMQRGFNPLIVLNDREYTQVAMQPIAGQEEVFGRYLQKSLFEINQRVITRQLPQAKNSRDLILHESHAVWNQYFSEEAILRKKITAKLLKTDFTSWCEEVFLRHVASSVAEAFAKTETTAPKIVDKVFDLTAALFRVRVPPPTAAQFTQIVQALLKVFKEDRLFTGF